MRTAAATGVWSGEETSMYSRIPWYAEWACARLLVYSPTAWAGTWSSQLPLSGAWVGLMVHVIVLTNQSRILLPLQLHIAFAVERLYVCFLCDLALSQQQACRTDVGPSCMCASVCHTE